MKEKILLYFQQFPIITALKFIAFDFIKKILNPACSVTYSQIGEDIVISQLLQGKKCGFYVDVGANEPQSRSNTFNLYKKGWNGVTIDGNEKLISLHKKNRPKDISICAVVSDKEEEKIFIEFEDHCLSSLNEEHINRWSSSRKISGSRKVQTVTLTNVLRQCKAPNNFDLLAVDVEGHDLEVLQSLDFSVYRPFLIVCEIHDFNMLDFETSEIYLYLCKKNNYRIVGYSKPNCYFCDSNLTKK